MVYTCCVPNCKGNYPNGPKVQVFSFPKEKEFLNKWIKAIHRSNFKPTKFSKVCALHFHPEDISKCTEFVDERTGRKVTAPLSRYKLKRFAIPSIFPNCPKYISREFIVRESPDERRKRLENKNLQWAVTESISQFQTNEKEKSFSSFSEFLDKMGKEKLPGSWNCIKRAREAIFLIIELTPCPEINISALINEKLELSVYIGKTELKKFNNLTLPASVGNVDEVISILNALLSYEFKSDVQNLRINSVCETLENIEEQYDENKQKAIQFIREQLTLINTSKENLRYSPESMILFSILCTISPHAYKFLRSSGCILAPHPRTIQRLCSSLVANCIFCIAVCRSNFFSKKSNILSYIYTHAYTYVWHDTS
ncbi:THAP domain-containing protein 5-like [Stegodyphus dumicola]|uniref:THAP domain-containing protein 5-like n=1 Tax=Stegodyphus dumicola TaxID=202533 RepID=UPI0015AE740B|nr:THAP domain-containing protein 5-like [Stegodyphus dumicola]